VPFLGPINALKKSVFDTDPAMIGEDLEISIEIGRKVITDI
jgi:hypothetical protein